MNGQMQDGLTYGGLMQGSANGAWGPREAQQPELAGLSALAERHAAAEFEGRKRFLARTIEAEIIPRLLLLHLDVPTIKEEPVRAINGPTEVLQFCEIITTQPLAAALKRVSELQEEGIHLEVIYSDLFTPAARHLGTMWEADTCSFADVTIGLSRLQQLMQNLSASFCEETVMIGQSPRALLIPSPGEQHTLGLFMVSEFFRREGWDVWGSSFHASLDVVKLVQAEWFDVVGFSLASESKLGALKPCIDALRAASINTEIKVLIGGPLLLARPDLIRQVGADAMALDAVQAVKVATEQMAVHRFRCMKAGAGVDT